MTRYRVLRIVAASTLLATSCARVSVQSAEQDSLRLTKGESPGPKGNQRRGERVGVPLQWVEGTGQLKPGDYGRWMNHGGKERFYEMHIPSVYRPGQPAPVVLVLHGGGGFPAAPRYQSGMDAVSDKNGFIAVYPAASHPLFKTSGLYWNAGEQHKNPKQRKIDDVQFISAVLDDLATLVSVDPRRVYATGISNGSAMSYRLASQLSDRIAAIGPVASQRKVREFDPPPPRPVPIIHFHGKRDLYCPYDGGTLEDSPFKDRTSKPVEECIKSWAEQYGCSLDYREERTGSAVRRVYSKGKSGAEVVLWTLEDGGHTWPGGRATIAEQTGKILGIKVLKNTVGDVSQAVNASEVMWEFFEQHPMPQGE